jgi:MFS transporter, ACS family, D-galactonate transporter
MAINPVAPDRPLRGSVAIWPLVTLLVVSVAINYIDRANLSVAAPLLKTEMGLSPAQLGLLLSSFFWTYSVCQIFSGWAVDRFNENILMAVGFVLWSGATAATGAIAGFASLLCLRLVLGVGESVAYPCYSKILTSRLTERQRGVANALIDAGSKIGPAIGTALGGLLVAQYGWRPFFVIAGVAGFLWLPAWLKWMPRRAAPGTAATAEPPGFGEILRHRSIWAACMGHFAGNYFWYFLLTWLPYYLVHERHFSMREMAVMGSGPPLVCAAASIIAAGVSVRALTRGATPTVVRKTCTVAGLGVATIIVLVPMVPGTTMAMTILMLASVGYGVFSSSHWAITQTIAGPLAAGRWSGLQNFVGNLAGVVAPALTGFVVGATGSFFWAFVAAGVVTLTGALAHWFALGRVEPAIWRGGRAGVGLERSAASVAARAG